MKKVSLIFVVIGICLLTACGTDNDEKKAEPKETDVAKNDMNENSNKKATEKTNENEQGQTDKSSEKEQEQPSETIEKKTDEATGTNGTEKKESKPVQQTAAVSSISLSEFNESATSPITGGEVTTVYTGTNPKYAFFGPLNITISKYKVESVAGSDKQIDAYSPESYLGRRDGYVITLDVIVENTTNSTITYKTDRMSLTGKDISKGASKENFIPTERILNNSSDEFPSMTKKEGYISYMLNQEDYDKLKQSTKLTANNPNDFNSPAIEGSVKGNITLDFLINK
ncbi:MULTISPECIES: DUF5068 domain-containing protein [Listeria]|uniref:DUF5068 domain-containing protein n=1 Tax=Listeria TaxID=1637 RepID=UPI0005126EE7|nr:MULTISPECIES: DUF5068 domain-containing protein [Listeria]AIS62318.1 hypothetical protein JL53_06085 [Listeria ivanovii subsp. londoniensis]MBC1424404.1 DUF5068 domain-containing protein [Listeria seeligeri]MBC1428716.1 DUF5068 domain-containing protein [Listeria seeligeri]MBC1533437.1 DUF5068 domain-containing protein [Listeria seeligeri]MBC1740453.1 DUF5068 domain-containing protein [Listeria seeligeri]